tara:strand:- start:29397 stop:30833 length:1437 start_codon:yes stop_codon:yes gene_type:complete
MKKLIILSLLLISCIPEKYFENAYCIENINLIDAKDGLKKNMTIVVSKNKIVKVEKSNKLILSKKNKIYNGKGLYMIPGLWDSHIHFAYEKELANSMFNLFIGHGITSVRDTGGELIFVKKWKKESKNNPNYSPRVKIAGPLIDGKFNVYNGNSIYFPPLSVKTASVEETEKMVLNLIKNGVDFLKAYEMLTPEQFESVIRIAKENNLKVSGHIPLSMDVVSASNLGINSIEHFRNIEMSSTSKTQELLYERRNILKNKNRILGSTLRTNIHNSQRISSIKNIDSTELDKVLNVLLENNTWQIPTISMYKGLAYEEYNHDKWKNSFEYLPKKIKNKWNNQILKRESPANNDSRVFSKWQKSMTNTMNKKGIKFMAGTDTPIFFQTPGYSLHTELEVLVESGLTPIQAIESATYNPAQYFKMQNELGLIKEGYIADLLILSKNPLEKISNTRKINAVIKNGNYMNRSVLDSLLSWQSKN